MTLRRTLCLLAAVLAAATPTSARVTRVEISSRSDVLGGETFAEHGAYERLVGRVYFSVAVSDPHNLAIVDLGNAVNLTYGEVEFSSDFVAIRPKDAARSNGTLILENPNRGRSGIVSLVDGGDRDLARSAGDAWLLRNGYSIVSLGWQWDAIGENALRLYAPIARESGNTITGVLRGDVMLSQTQDVIPLGHLITGTIGGSEYPVASADDPRNTLTVRDSRDAARRSIPRSQWQFAKLVDGKLMPSDRHLHLVNGFQAGRLYEYIYAVADPVVAGLGFAAVRDFAVYAKRSPHAVTPAQRVYGEGISQNGRFLRDFLYQGFNAGEDRQIALDGVLAHVAGAGRGNFNYRFAQPSRDAQPTSAVAYPVDIFPFTDLPEADPVTGANAGLLDRATAEGVVPKIFLSNTSYEYWGRAASLISTSVDGKRDVAISPAVRIYHFTGLQHFSGPFPPAHGEGDLLGRQPESPLPARYFWRAMISNLDAWVRAGTAPPPSSYPRVGDRTLVSRELYRFPRIPGITPPNDVSGASRLDFGPRWPLGIIDLQPPRLGRPFTVLVPQVDSDGNERDGVRLPELVVPLATYTGWNLRDATIGAAQERVAFEGSYIAFPKTAAERLANHDPRPSIAERYANRDAYLARYSAAVDALVERRWLLGEDREALMRRGREEWDEATK